MIELTAYGAVGDGATDDTDAIGRALAAAAAAKDVLHVPTGVFLSRRIEVPTGVAGIQGDAPALYSRKGAGSVLALGKGEAGCLLDLTRASRLSVRDLELRGPGRDPGKDPVAHGVCVDLPAHDYRGGGDCIVLDGVSVGDFRGDGLHLQNAGVVTVRHCIVGGNGGHGILAHVWDGWVLDCMLSGNGLCGFYGGESTASMTITGNRIEWNGMGGVWCRNAYRLSLTGNTIDHSGYAGMHFEDANTLAIHGNVIWRSGKPYDPPPSGLPPSFLSDPLALSQARFLRCRGVAFTGNALHAGLEDGDGGRWTPDYGLVLQGLRHSAFTGNSLWGCAMKEAVVDLGGHGEGFLFEGNAVSLATGELD